LTEGGKLPQVRPVEGFGESVTVPTKLFTEVRVIVEVPALVAKIVVGATGPVEMVKSGTGTVPYTPPFIGTPVMLNPFRSKIELRPLLTVTVSTLDAAMLGNTIFEPGPATAV
jgi:hypothetical protein